MAAAVAISKLLEIVAGSYLPAYVGISRDSELHNEQIRRGIIEHQRSLFMESLNALSEHMHDDREADAERSSTLMLIDTLLLGAAFAFVIEGQLSPLHISTGTLVVLSWMYCVFLATSFATLTVGLVLLYTSQRRASSILRVELAKRAAIRDAFFSRGVRLDKELLERARVPLSTGEHAPDTDRDLMSRMSRHVLELQVLVEADKREPNFHMKSFRSLLKDDPLYGCARYSTDILIAVGAVSLLGVAALVSGTYFWGVQQSVAMPVTFAFIVVVGILASWYVAMSESQSVVADSCRDRIGMWRCCSNGVSLRAYATIEDPTAWRGIIEKQLEKAVQSRSSALASTAADSGGSPGLRAHAVALHMHPSRRRKQPKPVASPARRAPPPRAAAPVRAVPFPPPDEESEAAAQAFDHSLFAWDMEPEEDEYDYDDEYDYEGEPEDAPDTPDSYAIAAVRPGSFAADGLVRGAEHV
jgi:hypothetical protein